MGKRVAPGVEKLGRQKYRLWWTDPRTHKECSVVYEGTKNDAVGEREDIVASIRRRTYVTASKVTVGEHNRAFLRAMKLKDDVSPATHRRYQSLLLGSLDEKIGCLALQDLTGEDIDAYYLWALENEETRRVDPDGERLKVRPNTVRKRHQALKMSLDDALAKRMIVRNPALDASPPRRRRPEGIAFSLEEARLVLERCERRDDQDFRLAVRIAFFTGLRLGEILALRVRDFDLERLSVTVDGKIEEAPGVLERVSYPKSSHSRRTFSVDAGLRDAVKSHMKERSVRRLELGRAWARPDLLLTTVHGGVRRPSTDSSTFTSIVRELESDNVISTSGATFHSCRHTHATELLRNGTRASVVAERLGHKDETVTLLYYSHVIPKDDMHAAGVFADAWRSAAAAASEGDDGPIVMTSAGA